jgi:hypothetical protein
MNLYRNNEKIAAVNPAIMTIAQAEALEALGYEIRN